MSESEEYRFYIDNAYDGWGEKIENQFWVYDTEAKNQIAKTWSYDKAVTVRGALEASAS